MPLFVLGLVAGIALALFVAFFRETYIDRAVLVLCMLTMSVASLLYIISGQYLVGMLLKWFPISGFDSNPAVVARFLALPVLVGVVSGIGADVRFLRTVFVEEMSRDYVRTARAKGCGVPRHGAARAAQRADRSHQCGGADTFPVPAPCCWVLLRHPRARRFDGGRPRQ